MHDTQPMTSGTDVIVIGAGVFGCGIAYELSRRGLKTLNVDLNGAPGHGSTSSSGAIIRFNYSTVAGVELAWEGNQYWTNFGDYIEADVADLAHKITTGSVMLRTHEELHRLWVENAAAVGVPYEDWDAETMLARLPFLSNDKFGPPCLPSDEAFWAEPTSTIPGGFFMPDAGYINDPQLVASNLHDAAKDLGAQFRFNAGVDQLLTTPDRSRVTGVRLNDGSVLEATVVVNAGGPFSASINEMAGIASTHAVSTRPMRHEVHVAAAPPGVDFENDGAIIGDMDQGMYFRPERGNQIFVGSADPECDGSDWVDDMSTLNREITEEAWTRQTMRLAKRLPGFGVPHQKKGLADAYDVSSDWGPIYDRTDLDGFYLAIGTSGNQFKNACVASNLMAELIVQTTDGHDHDSDPLIVQSRFTSAAIDMGAFSRNRTANTASSGTVLG